MTKTEQLEKIKQLAINGGLTIKLTKIIIPINGFNFVDDKVAYLTKIDSAIEASGIKGDKKRVAVLKNEKQIFLKTDNEVTRYDIDQGYFRLSIYEELYKKYGADYAPNDFKLGDLLNNFFKNNSPSSLEEAKNLVEEFCKFIPFVKPAVDYYTKEDYSFGFCCEECDGELGDHELSAYQNQTVYELIKVFNNYNIA